MLFDADQTFFSFHIKLQVIREVIVFLIPLICIYRANSGYFVDEFELIYRSPLVIGAISPKWNK